MKIYNRYLLGRLSKTFVLCLLILTFIISAVEIINFVNKYNFINSAEVGNLLWFFALIAVGMVVHVAPLCLFYSVIHTYRSLNQDRELVILEGAGLSKLSISKSVMTLSVAVFAMSLVCSVIVVPMVKRELNSFRALVKNFSEFTSFLEEGNFNKISDTTTIYVNSKTEENAFSGVVIYDQDTKNHYKFVTVAESATISSKDNEIILNLNKGSRQLIYDNNLQSLNFESLAMSIPINRSLGQSKLNIEEQPMYSLITSDATDPVIRAAVSKEIGDRLSWPLLSLGLGALGIASSLSARFSRVENIISLLVGCVFVVLYICVYFAVKTSTNIPTVIICATLNTIIFSGGAIYFVRCLDSSKKMNRLLEVLHGKFSSK